VTRESLTSWNGACLRRVSDSARSGVAAKGLTGLADRPKQIVEDYREITEDTVSANRHRLSTDDACDIRAENRRLNWSQLGSRIVQAGLAAAAIDLCIRERDRGPTDSQGALRNESNDSGEGRITVDG
jgi:hypothetical protein